MDRESLTFHTHFISAEQMMKRESYLKKAKHLSVKELSSPDGDLLSLPIISYNV